LLTHPQDAGLVLGAVSRSYYFSGEPSLESVEVGGASLVGDLSAVMAEAGEFPWTGLNPVAMTSQDGGLMLHANPHRMGLTIGFSSRALVALPADFRGEMFIHANEGDETPPAFLIRKEVAP
jgi:hypothetical protein